MDVKGIKLGDSATRISGIAWMTFLDSADAVSYVYDLEVRIGRPKEVGGGLPSVLAQDVLGRWVMVHDPAIGRLQFHVRSSDELLA